MEDYLDINKELWNEKTKHHINSDFYDLPSFKKGMSSLIGPEVELLGDLKGKKVLHLQCHFGLDSISLARLGADVTALDLSDSAISEGKKLSEELGVPVDFICADVYSTPAALNGQFDMVYTSYGTIGWLPNLDKWAAVVSRVLKAGGRLVFAEFHPVVWMFDSQFKYVQYSYFNHEVIIETNSGTYAAPDAPMTATEVSWNHPLSEVFTALLKAGMQIQAFEEYNYSPYACLNNLKAIDKNQYIIEGLDAKIPMMYTLEAHKTK